MKNYDKICHNNNHKNHLLEIQFDVSGIHSSVLPLHAPAKYYRESASAGIRRGCIQVTIQLTTDHSETLNPLYIVYSHFRLLQNMIESASAGIRRCCVQINIRLTTDHSEKYSTIHSSVLPLHAPAKYYRESASAIIRRCCKQITIRLTIDHLEKYNPHKCVIPLHASAIYYTVERVHQPAGCCTKDNPAHERPFKNLITIMKRKDC